MQQVSKGAAVSPTVNVGMDAAGRRVPRVLAGDYTTRAAVEILAKDLGLALETGAAARAALPICAIARQSYIATSALGHGQEDDAALVKYYAGVAGVGLPGEADDVR